MTADYHNSLETIDKKEATCELITNIISDCSQLWEECQSEDDIRWGRVLPVVEFYMGTELKF